jgi:hypothetical protein
MGTVVGTEASFYGRCPCGAWVESGVPSLELVNEGERVNPHLNNPPLP